MSKAPSRKKTQAAVSLDFAFFKSLTNFQKENRSALRKRYRELTKKFLDFNDPGESEQDAYLRRPQFEALETYVFLKEFAENRHVHQLFEEWAQNEGIFEGFVTTGLTDKGQATLIPYLELHGRDQYEAIFNNLKARSRDYPNYIFALTMGTGKTILMATCIFYEFLLANKWRKDTSYCQNALVFAPDRTVLQSLKEIQTFDVAKVVPPEYVNFVTSNIKFHFLDDTSVGLGTMDGSQFNIVISNTQKIILKKRKAQPSVVDQLFSANTGGLSEIYGELYELLGQEAPESDADLAVNARFQKLARLPRLGIYVDEAHHSMGAALAKDLGQDKTASALRTTIDELAKALKAKNSSVVACYNFTGTPYVGDQIMPEVVYAYSLKDAIANEYLKQPRYQVYQGEIRSSDFIRTVIKDFWENEGTIRREGMLPKLAFFGSTIDEVRDELRPSIESVLAELNIPTDRVLVNVGDEKLTTNDDIREFIQLDTERSEKQFIVLVGKGREGWNCRSLFGVALYREPKSKIFVLQSTMRCLRSIGDIQETGHIYLSEANGDILEAELQQNFRVTKAELERKNSESETVVVDVSAVPPPVVLKLARERVLYDTKRRPHVEQVDFGLTDDRVNQYRVTVTTHRALSEAAIKSREITSELLQREFSRYTLTAELARYFQFDGLSPFDIEEAVEASKDGPEKVLSAANLNNRVVYEVLIPALFRAFFKIESFSKTEIEEVELIRGYNQKSNVLPTFRFRAKEHLLAKRDYPEYLLTKGKSFHLDAYCFDSRPEHEFFKRTLSLDEVEKVYFTGMLVHGQSGFQVNYIDPESHTVRNYHPDFLVQTRTGKSIIVEVKNDWTFNDPVVQAKKEAATRLASHNQFQYEMLTIKQFDEFCEGLLQASNLEAGLRPAMSDPVPSQIGPMI
ncbi:type III restriction enzyme [Bradyrhizobium ottawaense]|uniref:TnsA endonuclease N-terminal domain-containing protein n=1 Tax=Bradyrhizobium ottawaense TaxID=931866 RepID=UPI003515408B